MDDMRECLLAYEPCLANAVLVLLDLLFLSHSREVAECSLSKEQLILPGAIDWDVFNQAAANKSGEARRLEALRREIGFEGAPLCL